jgi:hypothetical protein
MRSFSEPYEPEDIFDRIEAAERRSRIDAARQRNEAAAAQEAIAEAARKESSRTFTLQTNERLRLSEYRAHGVSVPIIAGEPTKSSFHMLISLGWKVEEVFGGRELIPPPPAPPEHKRKTRADYDQSS